jgi:hypothetical protein
MSNMEESLEIKYIVDAKEIFTQDPDNPEQTILTIPPNVIERAGLKIGDEIKISIGDQGTIILEKAK